MTLEGTINTLNTVKGEAWIYWAPFGTTEPAQTNAALTEDPPEPWICLGALDKSGCSWDEDQTVTDTEASQVIDPIGGRVTKRLTTVTFNMLEQTLANLAIALNNFGTTTVGTGITVYDPGQPTAGSIPDYSAFLVDGQAPQVPGGGQARRRAIFRKVMNNGKVKSDGDPSKDKVWAYTGRCYWVSGSISPWISMDQTA
jgi:hypothetical protein